MSSEIWGGAALGICFFCIIISHFVPPGKNNNNISLQGVFKTLAWLTGVIGSISLFTIALPYSIQFIYLKTGLSEKLTYNIITITSLLLFLFGLFLYGSGQSKEANDNSQLNRRQQSFVCFYILLIFSVFYILWLFANPVFYYTMTVIMITAELISIFFWFYDPIIYLLSGIIHKKPDKLLPHTPGKKNRFAVIGCAHNEENVIAGLIQSVYANTYPRDFYDIYVICDNCNDDTASVVKKENAIAMERNNPEKRGKSFGLEWMFHQLDQMEADGIIYDAYIILDADNLINREYLDRVNDCLNEGYEILQTYLGCKNAKDSWISKSYSLAYWLSNNIYQNAHNKIGLSAQMGGTGMVFRPSVIREIGWNTDSLTEDLDLTTRYILNKNHSCCWVHDAQIYDEKPLKIKPSAKQRTRWMQGHMSTMIKYVPQLLKKGISKRSMKMIDNAIYLMRPFLNLLLTCCYFIRWMSIILFPHSFLSDSLFMNARTAFILAMFYFLLQAYALWKEKQIHALLWKPIEFIYSFTWYLPIFRGLVKYRERHWVSTRHTRKMKLEDIISDKVI